MHPKTNLENQTAKIYLLHEGWLRRVFSGYTKRQRCQIYLPGYTKRQRCQIYLFEALPENIQRMRRNKQSKLV